MSQILWMKNFSKLFLKLFCREFVNEWTREWLGTKFFLQQQQLCKAEHMEILTLILHHMDVCVGWLHSLFIPHRMSPICIDDACILIGFSFKRLNNCLWKKQEKLSQFVFLTSMKVGKGGLSTGYNLSPSLPPVTTKTVASHHKLSLC